MTMIPRRNFHAERLFLFADVFGAILVANCALVLTGRLEEFALFAAAVVFAAALLTASVLHSSSFVSNHSDEDVVDFLPSPDEVASLCVVARQRHDTAGFDVLKARRLSASIASVC